MRSVGSRRIGRLWLAGAALCGLSLACGEDTPEGRALANPATQEAVPAPAPAQSPTPPPVPERDPGEPEPRSGAPAAFGDAPDRPVQTPIPEPEPGARDVERAP
jgi:hypothetical protein